MYFNPLNFVCQHFKDEKRWRVVRNDGKPTKGVGSSNHPRMTGFRGVTQPGRIGIAQFATSRHRGDGAGGDAETTGRDANTQLESKWKQKRVECM